MASDQGSALISFVAFPIYSEWYSARFLSHCRRTGTEVSIVHSLHLYFCMKNLFYVFEA